MDGGNSSTSSMNRSSKARRHDRQQSENTARLNGNMTELHRSRSPSIHPHPHALYDEHYNNEHRSRRARLRLPPLDPSNRYLGDGFDFRRPIMATVDADRLEDARRRRNTHSETIDLTREVEPEIRQSSPVTRTQRLPRYGRDIIDISSSDDESAAQSSRTSTHPQQTARSEQNHIPAVEPAEELDTLFVQDDDLEFLRTESLSFQPSRNASVLPGATDGQSPFIDLTEDAEDDLMLLESRSVSSINRQNPTLSANVRVRDAEQASFFDGLAGMLPTSRLHERLAAHYEGMLFQGFPFAGRFNRFAAQFTGRTEPGIHHAHEGNPRDRPRERGRPSNHTATHARPGGITMDYMAPAFDLGTGGYQQPGPQSYESPEPPPEGFTRNPAPNEEVVCPNCGNELAVGESDLQRQVWAIKQCGHAYCGTCVQTRLQAKKGDRDKGKARADAPPTLKKCVVENCGKPVTKTSMVHVFLSN
ncbi:hypothetical protein AMS68_000749 [Peltaster fructicola]|uniref:RING-type domain-containing protein n=1 Tax=Peltaster fructicola TaxID=286661 RepID=A0A6H0XKH6_9PEZI|nr:hypothetical protein AMS68_000749 [Peltaster fructicola]